LASPSLAACAVELRQCPQNQELPMKRFATIVLVLVAASVAFAQETAKKKKKGSAASSDEQAITQIENEWGAALVARDFAVIDRITSPDWMLTTPDGVVHTKAEMDAMLKDGKVKFESFKVEKLTVRIYGEAAVVFGLTTEKLMMDGKSMDGQNQFTDTFVKRDGKWQCVATHVSAVEKK
jgi:ketosteroid isomerase-like protein